MTYHHTDLHLSLDAARTEIRRRWEDINLRITIEDELGDKFMPNFKKSPRAVSFRQDGKTVNKN